MKSFFFRKTESLLSHPFVDLDQSDYVKNVTLKIIYEIKKVICEYLDDGESMKVYGEALAKIQQAIFTVEKKVKNSNLSYLFHAQSYFDDIKDNIYNISRK